MKRNATGDRRTVIDLEDSEKQYSEHNLWKQKRRPNIKHNCNKTLQFIAFPEDVFDGLSDSDGYSIASSGYRTYRHFDFWKLDNGEAR